MAEIFKGMTVWSVLDQVVFYLYLILFIWGGSNKFGRKLEFNDDFTSLDAMKSLRGFAAMGVILHHISQEEVFQKSEIKMWECRYCGHIHIGKKAPKICPMCGAAQASFEINKVNY